MSKPFAAAKHILEGIRKKPRVALQAIRAQLRGKPATPHGSFADMPRRLRKGYESQNKSHGVESVFALPLQYAAKKVIGEKPVQQAIWKHVQKPLLSADMRGGKAVHGVISKVLPESAAKGLTSFKEKVPLGNNRFEEVSRHSLTAPLVHAAEIAKPLALGAVVEKGVSKLREKKKEPHDILKSAAVKKVAASQQNVVSCNLDGTEMNLQQREKIASTMLHLHQQNKEHEKRAHATQLIYKMAEAGHIELPRSFDEFQIKLASLMKEDLAVVEKAIDYSGGVMKLGELDKADTSEHRNATEAFRAAIIGEY
jgi:hypothetical protein